MPEQSGADSRSLFEHTHQKEFLEFKKTLDERHLKRMEEAVNQGQLQGSQNLPGSDDQHPHPYQGQLGAMYQGDMSDIRLTLGQTLPVSYTHLTLPTICSV